MKLENLIEQFISYKLSLGMKYISSSRLLRRFCREMGNVDTTQISPDKVRTFLYGSGKITRFWHVKAAMLRRLNLFAQGRGYPFYCPLPAFEPKKPEAMKPYIYSTEEICRILKVVQNLRPNKAFELEPVTLGVLLLLIYGAALRLGEAISLTMADVDLANQLLTIRQAKFFKTRLVPIGPKLATVLADYLGKRREWAKTNKNSDPFFIGRSGRSLTFPTVETWFRRACHLANVSRESNARYQPRLHDLRHTAAVHRLLAWYRNGADLSRNLHFLSVYLGHTKLQHTQVYLSLTPELLAQANRRFQRYAFSEASHV
jgi:integrase/recombinase XerD